MVSSVLKFKFYFSIAVSIQYHFVFVLGVTLCNATLHFQNEKKNHLKLIIGTV